MPIHRHTRGMRASGTPAKSRLPPGNCPPANCDVFITQARQVMSGCLAGLAIKIELCLSSVAPSQEIWRGMPQRYSG